ncbi:YbhB/YbcL family Raf kinase inhibitor-like protein [Uliginosibacterium sp. sgz301328]|uniref:YbhB/YbcL family Raf kinase inhibitor-like protein n=1 Tax=Uliginosibacterium sp. sgz301328 TaxID=3243764 RepID=UPI00359D689B
MRLTSHSITPGARINPRNAAGKPDDSSIVSVSDDINPHLAWSDVPVGTRSFAVIVHDPDAPSRGDDVNKTDREVPPDLPRVDFFHWVLVDLPPDLTEIREGEFSNGLVPHGRPGPETLYGARHGINDYTGWFAGDPQMAGDYYGYDGPFPPFNDSIEHRYRFTVYALDVDRLPVSGRFTGQDVLAAIKPHTLGQASIEGTYTLNKRLI